MRHCRPVANFRAADVSSVLGRGRRSGIGPPPRPRAPERPSPAAAETAPATAPLARLPYATTFAPGGGQFDRVPRAYAPGLGAAPIKNCVPAERAMAPYVPQLRNVQDLAFLPPHMSEGVGRLFPGPPLPPQAENLDMLLGPPPVVRREEYTRL